MTRKDWRERVRPGWLVMVTWGTGTCTWTSPPPSTARRWWTGSSLSSTSGPAVTGATKISIQMRKQILHRGSISAEHGLGFKKRNFIHFSKSDSAVFLMKQIKQVVKMQIYQFTYMNIFGCVWYLESIWKYYIIISFFAKKDSLTPTKTDLQVFDPKGIMNPYKVLPDQWTLIMSMLNKLIQPNLDQASWYWQ